MEYIAALKSYIRNADKRKLGNKLKKMAARVLWKLFRTVLLIGLCFVLLYPLIYMLSVSFRTKGDMADPSIIWIPKHFVLTNVIDSFKFMEYPKAFFNTFKLGLVSTVFSIVSCTMAGYGFARFKFKGMGLFFAMVLFTIFVPPQVIFVPTFLMYRNFDIFGIGQIIGLISGKAISMNLLNTTWTYYLPAILGVGMKSGLYIYIFRQFYKGMPKELEDSAYIDGCGHFNTFIRIIIPNAGAALLTVFLFSFVWYWNDYFHASMYFSNAKTISTALLGITEALTNDPSMESIRMDPYQIVSRMQAGCLLSIAPVLLMYVFLQKYFTESIERTGIVG